MTTLNQISIGGHGRVTGVSGVDEVSVRLMEMGLTPGVEFSVVGSAPLGDPLEIELRGYRLSVRRSEAALVEVTQA